MITNAATFYSGSLTPDGFFSVSSVCAEDSHNTRTFVVRGGVSESASFIGNVCTQLEKEGLYMQKFRNSFAPESLDGAYLPDVDVYIFDGNLHNSFIMSMPDSRQYSVDLSAAANKKELYLNKAIIREAMDNEKKYKEKAVRFLSAVKSVSNDTQRLASDAVNAEKIERFVARFVKKELGSLSSFSGKEYFRFLTSITPQGVSFPENTLVSMCPKIYCIDDKIGTVSELLISQIRESTLLCGFDVVNMLSPLKTQCTTPEHIFIPELGVGIITSNEIHHYRGECFRKVSSARFLDGEKMKKHKSRIRFNISARKELLNQAYFLLGEAKKHRDEYFEVYSRSFDKEKIQSLEKETVKEILTYFSCT